MKKPKPKVFCKDCKFVGFNLGIPICKNPETLIGEGQILRAYGKVIESYHSGNSCRYHNSKNDCKLFELDQMRKKIYCRTCDWSTYLRCHNPLVINKTSKAVKEWTDLEEGYKKGYAPLPSETQISTQFVNPNNDCPYYKESKFKKFWVRILG